MGPLIKSSENLYQTISWEHDRFFGHLSASINISNTKVKQSKIYFSDKSLRIMVIHFRHVLLAPFLTVHLLKLWPSFCGFFSFSRLWKIQPKQVCYINKNYLSFTNPNSAFYRFPELFSFYIDEYHRFVWDILLLGTSMVNKDHANQETEIRWKRKQMTKKINHFKTQTESGLNLP